MKTNPERHELLNELLAEAAPVDFRAASLQRTLVCARRRRRWHQAMPVGGVAVLLLLAAFLWRGRVDPIDTLAGNSAPPSPVKSAGPTVPGTSIRELSDDELLALFPDRPVALVGPPQNREFVLLDTRRVPRLKLRPDGTFPTCRLCLRPGDFTP